MVRIPLEASFYPPEQPCPGHRRGDSCRNRTGRAFHHQAHRAADPGGLERTAEALRLPGAVMAGTAWRQEESCRLFAVISLAPQPPETPKKCGNINNFQKQLFIVRISFFLKNQAFCRNIFLAQTRLLHQLNVERRSLRAVMLRRWFRPFAGSAQ